MSGHPHYARWMAMLHRCHNPKHHVYRDYGGRGVSVCDRWRRGDSGKSGLECFHEDMGPCPPGLTLDRIDNDGGYSAANCRWATWEQQVRNRRAPAVIEMVEKISIRQIKAARELLAWAQYDLARTSRVSIGTIRRLEARDGELGGHPETRAKIIAALAGAGIDFYPDDNGGLGVRLRRRK